MATSYTTILKLALPATGELAGTWGDVVNQNITSMIEEAIAGLAVINTWVGASHTLTTANGTTSESRAAVLDLSGSPGGAATVICPDETKIYVVRNGVTGGFTATIKTSAGTGITIPNGRTAFVFCDGTNVELAADFMDVAEITTLTSTTGNITTVNATTVDTTNIAVTNLKAKDGTSAGSIADSTGVVTLASSVLTTTDINGGSIDGTVIGGSTPAAGTFTALTANGNVILGDAATDTVTVTADVASDLIPSVDGSFDLGASGAEWQDLFIDGTANIDSLVADTADINGGSIDGTAIGANTASTGDFTNLEYTGTLTGSTGILNLGSGQIYKDASGNVGIGNSTPNFTSFGGTPTVVSIGSSSASQGIIEVVGNQSSDGNVGLIAGYNTAGTARVSQISFARTGANNSGSILFQTNNAGSFAERMRLTPEGNVGIGTSSPGYKLQVAGSISSTASITDAHTFTGFQYKNSASEHIAQYKKTSNSFAYYWRTSDTGFNGGGNEKTLAEWYNDRLVFCTNNTERMRIDSSGNLLVGTTSPLDLAVTTTPGFSYNNNNKTLALSRSGNACLALQRSTSNGSLAIFLRDTTTVGSISVSTTATAYNTSSDYRLKEDAQPVLNPIDRLMQLKPINFAWKVDGSRTDGFLAHEAQAVVPEAVTGQKDAVDKDGKPEHQGIDQSKLVPLLTAALQDAVKRIEQLEAQINSGV